MPFSAFKLSSALLRALTELGYAEPYPIQVEAIPPILDGRDLWARAKTGSGKTLAYALPILERLTSIGPIARATDGARGRGNPVSALVLVPTRELAIQVAKVFADLARAMRSPLAVRVVHGGVSINTQMLALRGGADILVATPGRLIDLQSKNAVRLDGARILVLDEADKMLDLGFRDELSSLLALLPARRQSLLFSATASSSLEALASLRDPARIVIEDATPAGAAPTGANVPQGVIEELAYLVGRDDKGPLLRRIIARRGYDRFLVFASSTRRADNVARKLINNGVAAAAFHGDMSQGARTKALDSFRAGSLRVLVASDLASRGLDIEGLPCVVNYELPRSPLDYVHRIGRTGRADQGGLAVSLVSPDEEDQLRVIEKRIGRKLPRAPEGSEI